MYAEFIFQEFPADHIRGKSTKKTHSFEDDGEGGEEDEVLRGLEQALFVLLSESLPHHAGILRDRASCLHQRIESKNPLNHEEPIESQRTTH